MSDQPEPFVHAAILEAWAADPEGVSIALYDRALTRWKAWHTDPTSAPSLKPANRYRATLRNGTVIESPKPEPKCLGIAHLPQGTVFLPDSVGPERLYLVTDEGSAVCLDSGIVREDWWFASNEVDVVQAKMVVSKRRFKDRKSTSPSASIGAR